MAASSYEEALRRLHENRTHGRDTQELFRLRSRDRIFSWRVRAGPRALGQSPARFAAMDIESLA